MSEERWLKETTFFDDRELLSKPIDELTEEDLQKMPHVSLYADMITEKAEKP